MTQRTIKHEIKLQKSVVIILAIFAVGVFLNAVIPTMTVKDAFANSNLGTKDNPLYIDNSKRRGFLIECNGGCY